MREVGIVGGGLMGCLTALNLALRGLKSVIHERGPRLLDGASNNNEGKVHVGFTYGLDQTAATPRLLFDHGSRFEPLLRDLIGADISATITGRRQHYAIHAGSALDPAGVDRHFASMAARFDDPQDAVRELPLAAVREQYGDDIVRVFDVMETSLDCVALCDLVRERVLAAPEVTVFTGAEIARIEDGLRPEVITTTGEIHRHDVVVNCAWDGLPAIERRSRAFGHALCLRAKAGFVTEVTTGRLEQAVTIVFGPYGDIVPMDGSRCYVSWYPAALMAFSTDMSKGSRWYEEIAGGFDFAQSYRRSVAAFARLLPTIGLAPTWSEIRAGAIVAAGATDISDLASGLHKRHMIGIYRRGNVFAVDTGKLTSAPVLAADLAGLIA